MDKIKFNLAALIVLFVMAILRVVFARRKTKDEYFSSNKLTGSKYSSDWIDGA